MEALAAVAREPHGAFTLDTIEIAEPRAGEVLVELQSVGICHTDLAARDGVLPISLPAVLGHEGCGIVVEVGPGVSKVAPGDRVGITFASCGDCPSCRDGEPSYCHFFTPLNYGGAQADGTKPLTLGGEEVFGSFFGQSSFATHALATERNVVKVRHDVPAEIVAPLGCGIQTGAGAVLNSLNCAPGSSVLVAGAGSVGLAAVMAAAVRGCTHIIAVEPHEARRALALELGATHVIDPSVGPLADQVRALLPDGVDNAIDTSGNVGVIEGLVPCMTNRGKIGLIGVPADPAATVSLSIIGTLTLGLSVIGIIEGDSDPDVFVPELIEMYLSGKFPLDKLITTFPFGKINDAIDAQHRGEVVKPVLLHD